MWMLPAPRVEKGRVCARVSKRGWLGKNKGNASVGSFFLIESKKAGKRGQSDAFERMEAGIINGGRGDDQTNKKQCCRGAARVAIL